MKNFSADLSKADREGERKGGENEALGARDAAKIMRGLRKDDKSKAAKRGKRGGYR